MKRQVIGLMLGVVLLGAGYAQAGTIIDTFDQNQGPIARHPLGAEPVSSATDANSIVPTGTSHTRDMLLVVLQSDTTLSHVASAVVDGSALSLGNSPGIASKLTLTYDNLGGVDLTGPGTLDSPTVDTKPWLIFHVTTLDLPLVVTVQLFDGLESSTNTYVKLPDQGLSICAPPGSGPAIFPLVLLGTSACPQIVGPIFAVSPADPGQQANYYHALAAFVDPTLEDPVTGEDFGSKTGGFTALSLESIDKIVIAFTAPSESQDFETTCLHTGAAPSGAQPNANPSLIEFGAGDGLESSQCVSNVVPEPSSILLLGTGFLGIGLAGFRSRLLRRRQQA